MNNTTPAAVIIIDFPSAQDAQESADRHTAAGRPARATTRPIDGMTCHVVLFTKTNKYLVYYA